MTGTTLSVSPLSESNIFVPLPPITTLKAEDDQQSCMSACSHWPMGDESHEIEKMMNLRALKHQESLRAAGKCIISIFVLYITLIDLLFYIDHKVIEINMSLRPMILSSRSMTLKTHLRRMNPRSRRPH